ncbi:MAG TPA: hypothetical protein PKE12_01220 [Kiritimatiellia bacterium]|nr:hypothetical protein [Kiritimatiellia bacterium]
MNLRTSTLLGLLSVGALLAPTGGSAHEFWLDADSLRPPPDTEIAVYVRSGHYFPASALLLSDRLLRSLTVTDDVGVRDIPSVADKRERVARLLVRSNGVHRIDLTIQRPQMMKPDAWARLWLVPSGVQSDPTLYTAGQGLELAPRTPIENARVGAPLPISALRDGTPLRARIQIQAAEGGGAWINSTPDEPGEYTPRKSGRHIAIVSDGGQTSTLVFEVSP